MESQGGFQSNKQPMSFPEPPRRILEKTSWDGRSDLKRDRKLNAKYSPAPLGIH
jgi:hypothetical protein